MLRRFNPATLYEPQGQYPNAVEVPQGYRLVFSSGIIGLDRDGQLIRDPESQIRQAWANVAAFLAGTGLTPDNLVRLTMHLTDADLVPISKNGRIAALGEAIPCAVTGLIVGLFDPDLVVELNVIAAIRGHE